MVLFPPCSILDPFDLWTITKIKSKASYFLGYHRLIPYGFRGLVVATRIKRDITPKWHVRRSKYTNVDHGKFTDRDFSEWYIVRFMRTNSEKRINPVLHYIVIRNETIHQILRYRKYVFQEVCHMMADELETKW